MEPVQTIMTTVAMWMAGLQRLEMIARDALSCFAGAHVTTAARGLDIVGMTA